MSKSSSDQASGHGAASPLPQLDGPYSTPPFPLQDAYSFAGQLWDESNHGSSLFQAVQLNQYSSEDYLDLIPHQSPLSADMSQTTLVQESQHDTASPFGRDNEPYSTSQSRPDDVYFDADELLDECNHGLNLEDNTCADQILQSPCLDQCSHASNYNVHENSHTAPYLFQGMADGQVRFQEATPVSCTIESNLFQSAQTFAHQTPSIQASQPWAYTTADVCTHLQPVNCVSTSGSQMCTTHHEGRAMSSVLSANNFFGGHISSLTAITGSTSSGRGKEMSIDSKYSPQVTGETPVVQQNLGSLESKTMTRSVGVHEDHYQVSLLVFGASLDTKDGYDWHKYGRKMIKDNIYPREYYRCSHAGCSVKKQAELSSELEGGALFTYFNRHNHHPEVMKGKGIISQKAYDKSH